MDSLNNYFVGILESTESKQTFYSDLLKDNINGYGKYFKCDSEEISVYSGIIKNSKMNGDGYIIYIFNKNNPTHKTYKGKFINNKYDGLGTIIFTNGDIFIGNFSEGKMNGFGKMYNSNGELIIENVWKNDIICGKVEYIEYHHGTKNPKVIGNMYDSVKIGCWLNIDENQIINSIDYYNDITESKTETNIVPNTIIKQLTTHNSGYIKVQCLNFDTEPSINSLCLGFFKSVESKQIYKNIPLSKKVVPIKYLSNNDIAIIIRNKDKKKIMKI